MMEDIWDTLFLRRYFYIIKNNRELAYSHMELGRARLHIISVKSSENRPGSVDLLILIKQVNYLCSSIVVVEKDEEAPVHQPYSALHLIHR